MSACTECGGPVVYKGRGPRGEQCSGRCRTRAWRRRQGEEEATEIWDLLQIADEATAIRCLSGLSEAVRQSVLGALQGLREETRTGSV